MPEGLSAYATRPALGASRLGPFPRLRRWLQRVVFEFARTRKEWDGGGQGPGRPAARAHKGLARGEGQWRAGHLERLRRSKGLQLAGSRPRSGDRLRARLPRIL